MKKWVYIISVGFILMVLLLFFFAHLKESEQREAEHLRLQQAKDAADEKRKDDLEDKVRGDSAAKAQRAVKDAVEDTKTDANKDTKKEAGKEAGIVARKEAEPVDEWDAPPAEPERAAADNHTKAKRVVLVTNSEDPDSLRIARHYAEVRGVPAENILSLPMSRNETISWPEFVKTIWQPLEDQLVEKKWIDGIGTALTDAAGRRKYAFNGHRIAYLILCRGVPLRISADEGLAGAGARLPGFLGSNQASVDSELSLLAQTAPPLNGFVPNVLYRNARPNEYQLAAVVKVARLDGPTAADANQLVDRAVAAERSGLLGRAYVDIGGKYPEGDRWFETTAKGIGKLGFDLDVDRSPQTIPLGARFDAPVLYFGWYSDQVTGPFRLPGFQFPPGAIAEHIYSYSAETLRSATARWCGPLLAAGVTATVGNVFEPDLHYLHRPDLLLLALARGHNFGDAAYFSLPVLSWQSVAVGDPLYRPFGLSFQQQWAQRAQLPERLAGYAVLRRMRLDDLAKKDTDALALAREAQYKTPSIAVGLALARRLHAAKDDRAANAALDFTRYLKQVRPDEWALVRECARQLEQQGAPAQARDVYRLLLNDGRLPRELRAPWLREAKTSAANAGDYDQASAWGRELDDLMMQARSSEH